MAIQDFRGAGVQPSFLRVWLFLQGLVLITSPFLVVPAVVASYVKGSHPLLRTQGFRHLLVHRCFDRSGRRASKHPFDL
jgi:hypothetical protein